MTQGLCIVGGRVLDPASNSDSVRNVYLKDGVVQRVSAAAPGREWEVFDAGGAWVSPGLIDMHVHLRQPGREEVETIETGTKAAAAGGVTSVMCMPNTKPPIDRQTGVEFVRRIAQAEAWSRVYVVGTITKEQKGDELSEIGEIVLAGAVAISDDGHPVMNSYIMRRALEYSKLFDIPVIQHAEDIKLTVDGVMNEGHMSTVFGLAGTPGAAESVIVARDAILAELTGARLHVAHISAKHSVELVRWYKSRGVAITAEATPHHFTLTDARVEGYDTHAKMSPPLRAEADRDEVVKGLMDGTIDVIATDHAPHSAGSKACEFDRAPNGIVGLETLVPIAVNELHHKHGMSPLDLIALLTVNPARIARLPGGSLSRGAPGDVTVIDPTATHTVDAASFHTKGRNTPFDGYQGKGKTVATVIGGTMVYREGALIERPNLT